MYETIRIVDKLKPKYVIWENVKNLLSKKHRHNFDNYLERMESIGYRNYYQVLNARDYGIPQNRERVFTISIREDIDFFHEFHFPEKQDLVLKLKDVLEENVDEKYYLSDKGIKYVEKRDGGYTQIATEQTEIAHCPITAKGNGNWTGNFIKQVGILDIKGQDCIKRVYSDDGLSPTLTDMQGRNRQPKIMIKNNTKQGYDTATDGDSVNLQQPNSETRRGRVGHQVSQTLQTTNTMGVVEKELRIRKLTPKECWRLMGFKDDEFERAEKVNSNSQLYKQARQLHCSKRTRKNTKEFIGGLNDRNTRTRQQKILKVFFCV